MRRAAMFLCSWALLAGACRSKPQAIGSGHSKVTKRSCERANERREMVGYDEVEVRHGDGYAGWQELIVIERGEDGLEREQVLDVAFVPMLRGTTPK